MKVTGGSLGADFLYGLFGNRIELGQLAPRLLLSVINPVM